MKVAILGVTGETGAAILEVLLESSDPTFELTALVRPSSVGGDGANALEQRGVKIVPTDLKGPEDQLVAAVKGQDVIISAISPMSIKDQIPLVDAAVKAGVGRFVPCDWGPAAPPRGLLTMREKASISSAFLLGRFARKEDVRDHIKKVKQPYTFIDVGWWYQFAFPRVPSGKLDYFATAKKDTIAGDGSVKSALTDKRDIGEWVKRIITDPRTLNKQVFAYNELWTYTEIYDLMEKLSGETITRTYLPEEAIKRGIAEALASNTPDSQLSIILLQYYLSWGVRGDNTPEYAEYLGYLNAQELYPDFKPRSYEAFVREMLDGKGEKIYAKGQTANALDVATRNAARLT